MRHTRARSLALTCLVVSLVGCGTDVPLPLTPDDAVALFGVGGASTPAAPSSLTAAALSTSQIDLRWLDNSDNETGFEIQRSATGPAGTFAPVATMGANATTYSNTGLTALTQYCYKVRAFKQTGGNTKYSTFSNISCATTPGSPPAAPSNADAKPGSSTEVQVAWNDNSGTEDGFRVERSAASAGPWETAATTGPNATSYRDGGRASEQQVCYRVVAFNASGDSAPSNADCTAPPAGPTNLTANAAPQGRIDLTWADNSGVEDGYKLERNTGGAFTPLATLPANTTSYHDAAVSTGTTYWYRVRATKDGGSSDVSNTASATATATCPAYEIDCSNGVDDDCDGLVDRADNDCYCLPEPEGACWNGVDDDCDGLVDFADPDCQLVECTEGCGYGFGCFPDNYCHSHCEDGAKDYDESDADCGGSDCWRCGAGRTCNTGFDCASGICVNNVCQP